MSLRDRIAARIAAQGPITVADYMSLCLHDAEAGYYATRPALGAAGDFITAPHVSQMFGELLGLWAVETWTRLGRPPRIRLIEIGPGDGTMFGDVLRATRVAPDFMAACEPWLVETSAPLLALQGRTLSAETGLSWATSLGGVPSGAPVIILANEFLDCLAIEQAVWSGRDWRERRVGVSPGGDLAFVTSGATRRCDGQTGLTVGEVREWSAALAAVGGEVGRRIVQDGGAALFIDYGRAAPGPGDTLQALRGHIKQSPLADPGLADLTAHVDFPAFLGAARAAGAKTAAIATQAAFLRALGIETRAARLAEGHADSGEKIERQLARLIGADQMGELFKVGCIHAAALVPPGFEDPI